MNQVKFSPLSIYKGIDRNEHGVEASVLKAVMDRGMLPSRPWEHEERASYDIQTLKAEFRMRLYATETEAAHDATCRAMAARRSYDPIGDGNDSESAR